MTLLYNNNNKIHTACLPADHKRQNDCYTLLFNIQEGRNVNLKKKPTYIGKDALEGAFHRGSEITKR